MKKVIIDMSKLRINQNKSEVNNDKYFRLWLHSK